MFHSQLNRSTAKKSATWITSLGVLFIASATLS
jgi:hypothetical protein